MIANRTKEIELFNNIVLGKNPKRILLIEAESGFGKTWLLAKFKHTLAKNTLCVLVDLKSAQRGIPYIFSRTRHILGWKHFPTLNAAVERYLSSSIKISDTTMIGKDQQFSVVLSGIDEDTHNFRLTELGEAFFHDLHNIRQKIIFLFDSYEKSPTELALWLEGEFFTGVVDTHKLIVVIAGQKVPKPTIEWMDLHQSCCLKAIMESNAWYSYSQNAGFSLNQDEVKTAMRIFKGQPAEIVKTLEALAKEEQ